MQAQNVSIKAERESVKSVQKTYWNERGMNLSAQRFVAYLDAKTQRFDGLTYSTESLGQLTLRGDLLIQDGLLAKGVIELRQIELSLLQERFSALIPLKMNVNGTLKATSTFKTIRTDLGAIILQGQLDFEIANAALSAPGSAVALDALSMRGKIPFSANVADFEISFTSEGVVSGFQLRNHGIDVDLSDYGNAYTFEGRYNPLKRELGISKSKLVFKNLGSFHVSATVTGLSESPSFIVNLERGELSNQALLKLLARFNPTRFFTELTVDGASWVKLTVQGVLVNFKATGLFESANVNFYDNRSRKKALGVTIRLPFEIAFPNDSGKTRGAKGGFISIERLSWGPFQLDGLQSELTVNHNTLFFSPTIVLPIFDGLVRLQDMKIANLSSPNRQLTLSMSIDKLNLTSMTQSLGFKKLNGELSGVVELFEYQKNAFITKGEVIFNVFSGRIRLTDLSADNLFNGKPAFKTTIYFEEINLAELTQPFQFGQISGVLMGYVKELNVRNGRPTRFVAAMETVHRPKVPQWISVTAIEKVAFLGQGVAASFLNQGIYSLFNQYNYSKLGFQGILQNNTLTLQGIEKIGDKDYLIVGSFLPPKVDVVNFTHKISFHDMIQRLKRITQAKSEGLR
jgi:hypothetical protein